MPLRRHTPFVHRCLTLCLLLCLISASTGCAVRSNVSPSRTLDTVTAAEVRTVLQHGDWLVTRGVHGTDDFVSTVTNSPLSHAGVYDAILDEVIEAEASGVHATSLADFVGKSHRVLVLRPLWAAGYTRPVAVLRARSRIGSAYNFTGLAGLNTPGSYYCTQLCVDAYRPFILKKPDNPMPKVLRPGQMYHWGRIMYDSGPRESGV